MSLGKRLAWDRWVWLLLPFVWAAACGDSTEDCDKTQTCIDPGDDGEAGGPNGHIGKKIAATDRAAPFVLLVHLLPPISKHFIRFLRRGVRQKSRLIDPLGATCRFPGLIRSSFELPCLVLPRCTTASSRTSPSPPGSAHLSPADLATADCAKARAEHIRHVNAATRYSRRCRWTHFCEAGGDRHHSPMVSLRPGGAAGCGTPSRAEFARSGRTQAGASYIMGFK